MSEQKRKSFSSQYKAKVALEAIRGVKTVTRLPGSLGASDLSGVVEERVTGTGIWYI